MNITLVMITVILVEAAICYLLFKSVKELRRELKEAQDAMKAQEAICNEFSKSETKAKKNKKKISDSSDTERLSNALNILRNNKESRGETS